MRSGILNCTDVVLRHCFLVLGGASSTGIDFLGSEFDAALISCNCLFFGDEVKLRAFRAIICCSSSGVVQGDCMWFNFKYAAHRDRILTLLVKRLSELFG